MMIVKMDKPIVYFPNLNGLRFIAASLVIVHHIEQFKSIFQIPNFWHTVPFIEVFGKLGVVLFFVLSGFLITYLLLSEEYKYNTIRIKKFYIRRVLRIWPLYFLIIIMAFFILPYIEFFVLPGFEKSVIYENIGLKMALYILFLPNLALSLFGAVPFAAQTWSIGTEEQFYLVWPILFLFFKKHRLALMFFIITGYILVLFFLNTRFSDFIYAKEVLRSFWSSFNIDCMAIGGFFALLLFRKSKYLEIFMNNYVFYCVVLLLMVFMYLGIHFPYVHLEVYAFLFGIVILNFAANEKIKYTLEGKAFNYLGKISYGLYMFHPFSIVISLNMARVFNWNSNGLIYPLTFIMTILLAGISYKYYESIFLKWKEKFS